MEYHTLESFAINMGAHRLLWQENSPDPLDPLPGMCALTQSWLQEAVLGSFRETADAAVLQKVSLDEWFEAPWVNAYLQVGPCNPLLPCARALDVCMPDSICSLHGRNVMSCPQWFCTATDKPKGMPTAYVVHGRRCPLPAARWA